MTSIRRPKLGQHFLSSEAYRRRIAETVAIGPGDLVLEIGPGQGAMTGLLLERALKVVAVEIDAELVGSLHAQFAAEPRLEVLRADILQVDLEAVCRRHAADRLFAFGNLPYYITSPILRHLLGSASLLKGMGFVVQREVASRIASRPGSRDYGYLSVLAQSLTRPRIEFRIPPGAFSPPPAVNSALISFEMMSSLAGSDRQLTREFLDFVKLCFGQKRKRLANNLSSPYSLARARAVLRECGYGENARAEEFGVADFLRVFEAFQALAPKT